MLCLFILYCICRRNSWVSWLLSNSMWILSEAVAALRKWMQIFVSLPLCVVIAMELWCWAGFTTVITHTHTLSHTESSLQSPQVTSDPCCMAPKAMGGGGKSSVMWSMHRHLVHGVQDAATGFSKTLKQGCWFGHEWVRECVLLASPPSQKCKHCFITLNPFIHTWTQTHAPLQP